MNKDELIEELRKVADIDEHILENCMLCDSDLKVVAYMKDILEDDVDDEGAYESKLEVVGSGQTPISNGLSEKFSTSDIAHFYIAKELGPSWLNHLIVGYKTFCEDV